MRGFFPYAGFAAAILLWAGATGFLDISEAILPGPLPVFLTGVELVADGSLVRHAVASLFRVTVGFYLAVLAGIPLGILMGWWFPANAIINPMLQFLRPISPLAWIPLAMLWFGIGDKPAVFLIFLSSFFPIAVSTTVAVKGLRPTYFQVAANFGFSRLEVLTKLIFPAIMPSVFTALRISLAIAWLVVVAAEMIAVTSGLGYLIIDARNGLRMDQVLVAMILIGAIGLFLDFLMNRLASIRAFRWGVSAR